MAVAVQDDAREEELMALFQLDRPEEHSRGGIDAVLHIDGSEIPFEMKSTSRGSVTTVRDFGPDHIKKWEGKHWLIGFYKSDGVTLRHAKYGSPTAMAPWIEEKADYSRRDFQLAEVLPQQLDARLMAEIVGRKDKYSYCDALRIQKRQYKKATYMELMDLPNGYSPAAMLQILRDRARYLMLRGATLNNPHIPAGYFDGWEEITDNHAVRLRELVKEALQTNA